LPESNIFRQRYFYIQSIVTFMNRKPTFIILILVTALAGCHKQDNAVSNSTPITATPTVRELLGLPSYFDLPTIPADNTPTADRIALGRKLFYDTSLSRDGSTSCASCHHQTLAFADTGSVSFGVQQRAGKRNSPHLTNTAYSTTYFWDGGSPTLEGQIHGPLTGNAEFDMTMPEVVQRLNANAAYVTAFQNAYSTLPDSASYVRAIASFERTFISGNSKYDRYFFGNDSTALNASEIRGLNLFFSTRTQCGSCHNGFNFTNGNFEDDGITLVYSDSGRAGVTHRPQDVGKFKVPSLRNVAVTAPYMHNGSFSSLDAVLEHYRQGGVGSPNQSLQIRPFSITDTEKQDLLNFLQTLTDTAFLANTKLTKPN
jgi:cytochrome c peroxidase